ncbi:MAG TPA: SRPBCC domain-containing protein [Flavobacteriales bacterium]|jgi:uncharacterized protein YndB with AHSA1/START domain|nr:SRPBCC domain-containing protein [Flavobacteriales bacterium]
MNTTEHTRVVKDLPQRSIVVSRTFDAPIDLVWRAFTEKELLDLWWGPAPWRVETKFMDFREGGHWLYAMVGPNQERHWGRMNYLSIEHLKEFELEYAFCDADGNVDPEFPVSTGVNSFTPTADGTRVEIRKTYSTEEQLQQILEMGFAEGITACLEQLAAVLKTPGR